MKRKLLGKRETIHPDRAKAGDVYCADGSFRFVSNLHECKPVGVVFRNINKQVLICPVANLGTGNDMAYVQAVSYAGALNINGVSGFRMPSLDELKTANANITAIVNTLDQLGYSYSNKYYWSNSVSAASYHYRLNVHTGVYDSHHDDSGAWGNNYSFPVKDINY